MTSLEAGQRLLEWIKESGGQFNEYLKLQQDETSGLYIFSTGEIEPESHLISCPFSCAITPAVATASIGALCTAKPEELERWSEKMLIAAYLVLHLYQARHTEPNPSSWPSHLMHWAYVDALPTPESLLSPLQFTSAEKELLGGTNLHGAVSDRLKDLREEYERITAVAGDKIAWDEYLVASTWISSRAFPSRLLNLPTPNGAAAENTATDQTRQDQSTSAQTSSSEEVESHPVLLPGLDLFNHTRGQPITWLSSPIAPPSTSSTSQPIPCVSFLNPVGIPPNQQVYNNYGPKSNEELLLSYGFVIDPNPDDTVLLRLGTSLPSAMKDKLENRNLDISQRFLLRDDGEVPKDLLVLLRAMLGDDEGKERHVHGEGCDHDHDHDHEDHHAEVENEDEDGHEAHEKEMKELDLEMDVLGTLGGMLEDRLRRLQQPVEVSGEVRNEVRRMCEVYRQGQIRILERTLDKLGERVERLEGLLDQGMGSCPCGC